MHDQRREQLEAQKEQADHQAATQAAMQAQTEKMRKRLENPEFLDQLRDPDVDSEEFDWVENELGPRLSGAQILGNRSEQYERELKWGNIAKQEQMIAEGTPGRLCRGPLLKIAQGVHRRDDVGEQTPYLEHEKRVVRDAHDVATTWGALAIESKGIDALTTATTVNKRESQEEESSRLGRAGSIFD